MKRADFMTSKQRQEMGIMARTHQNCLRLVGVARPGKTAKDRTSKGK
jgi:hypothetical protein